MSEHNDEHSLGDSTDPQERIAELQAQIDDLNAGIEKRQAEAEAKADYRVDPEGDFQETLPARIEAAEKAGDWNWASSLKSRGMMARMGAGDTPAGSGVAEPDPPPSPEEVDERIAEAEAKGDWQTAMRLKTQRQWDEATENASQQ